VPAGRTALRFRPTTMVKLPAWDTPCLAPSAKVAPLYVAVNCLRELEATPGASPVEIASAQPTLQRN
jgi:hypothetical protein